MMASAEGTLVLVARIQSLKSYHEVQVNVVNAERLQRAFDTLFDALVPWVVELGGDPDLLTRNARVFNTLTNLFLVPVCKSCVDVAIAGLQSGLDSLANLTGL
jgi:hypothetical protein